MLSSIQKHGQALHKLQKNLVKSRFFTISLLLHIILVVFLGGTVLFNKYVEPPDFQAGDGFMSDVATNEPPPKTQATPPPFTVTPQVQTPVTTAIVAFNTQVPSTFTMPQTIAPAIAPTLTPQATPPPKLSGMSKEIVTGMRDFQQGWTKKTGNNGPGTSLQSRQFQFTAYLAKYSDGDWNSTVQLKAGRIYKGSLPNLLYVIGKLSRDKIQADPQPVPLDLSNWDDIWSKKPPFILFTGHRDFTLSEQEVENLQKYIRLGGCVWGDSSLPGLRSRFDIAFRREMRRVVPDVDKTFDPLPPDHPIYTKPYYPDIREVQPGINFYREPIYALKIYGEIAILYTANDYGDMWQFGINEKGEFDLRADDKTQKFVAMNDTMWHAERGVYLRNIEAPSVFATYKFGTNIIVHLLTRWEDKLRSAPKGL